jgi:hypothetical protein
MTLKEHIEQVLESKGSTFKVEVKFSIKDFEAWEKEAGEKVEVDKLDNDNVCIYVGKKHIGTYNKKTQVLVTDDPTLFGNYID